MNTNETSVLNNCGELRPLGDTPEEILAEEFMLQFAQNVASHLNDMHGVTLFRDLPPNIRMSVFAQGVMLGIMSGCIRGFMHGTNPTEAERVVREYIESIIEPAVRNFRTMESEGLIRTEPK